MQLFQVDAFTNELFRGNPAAVVPLESWLSDAELQAIAAENNLSETAFFLPKGQGFALRWFTPAVEVDLCGHATLATAHVLFQHLEYEKEVIRFETRSGELFVFRKGHSYVMDFPADVLEKVTPPDDLTTGLGVPVLECYRGKDDFLAVTSSQKVVKEAQPDFRRLAQLPSRGVILTAKGEEVDFVSRGFFPQSGVDEDPVTGSAHTTLTPYWSAQLNKTELHAWQLSQRGGALTCVAKGERVELYGQAVTYLVGTILRKQ